MKVTVQQARSPASKPESIKDGDLSQLLRDPAKGSMQLPKILNEAS